MNSQRLQSPVPIRFGENTKRRILSAAKRFRLPSSELIRRAVERQLPQWENGGKLVIESQEDAA